MDYFERVYRIESALCELSTELALRLLRGWHGQRLFSEGFYQHLVNEGILEGEEEEEDEDEDEGEENAHD